MTRLASLFAVTAAALLLTACGGGSGGGSGGGGGGPVVGNLTIVSDAAQDGYLAYLDAAAPRSRNLVNSIGAGDNDAYVRRQSLRGFVTFDLRALPPGARITSATVRVYQSSVVGSPYAKLGYLRLDHVDYGATLDYDEFGLPILGGSTVGNISDEPTLGWKSLDVTERLQADLDAARTRSQYRLRFGLRYNNDATNDWARFEDGEMSQGTVNPPLLVITYTQP